MAEPGNDINQPVLNLSPDEKRAFSFLFNQADSDQLGVVTGERAVTFFERTHVSPNILGEIWQIADTENRGLLTKAGFCMVLRLIGHYQAGRQPSTELAFKPGPVPKFDGLKIPGIGSGAVPTSPTSAQAPLNALQPQLSGQGPIRVPPLDPQKVAQYSGLFDKSGAQNGLLDGVTAKSIFERAGLPNEVLGKIWALSDREQKGGLDQTEFIIAMHLLTSMKSKSMATLPNVLPPALYEAAARRGVPPPPGSRPPPAAVPRQFTGGPARTQSPLARSVGYGTPPPIAAGPHWLVTPAEKAKYDQFFATIDTQGLGVVTGEQAVRFFSDSRLPEETLAQIWDLADVNSEGQLTKDEFAVAMYLIRQQRAPNAAPLPAFLPPALIPPSRRQLPQQQQSTAPAFDNAANTSNLPKSAADDLFGLDAPASPPPPGVQSQTTGAGASRDPFAGSQPGSPSSPQRFQPQPQSSTMFKPFMPTSAFGASLASQNTGGSTTSSQGQARGPAFGSLPSALQQSSANDDLLGDSETQAVESSKMTSETTELANMSTQIGNLRTQMEQTQNKKAATQQDLTATNTQKQALEQRLQQFRAQYEQEVRTVKELEQQLAASRESTKKMGQDLAMLEGTYQDLQTQHNSISQQLQADQQENGNLKQRITQINEEVARLKPEIEKMKLDARQQKGLVSINKKQLTTNESERDRLQSEKSELERTAAEQAEQARSASIEPQTDSHAGRNAVLGAGAAAGVAAAGFAAYETSKDHDDAGSLRGSPPPTSNVTSPVASIKSSTNPFFRPQNTGVTTETERELSPASPGPNPSAFDAIFGPPATFASTGIAGSRTGTPPATSFIGRSLPTATSADPNMTESVQSISTVGEATPTATPPATEPGQDGLEPPPPQPDHRQFTPSQLPVTDLNDTHSEDAESTRVLPPASRAGGVETPASFANSEVASPAPQIETVPGAFPTEEAQPVTSAKEIAGFKASTPTPAVKDEFDSAFASFGNGDKATEDAPVASTNKEEAPKAGGFSSEFPPIKSLEPEDDDDESDEELEKAFADNFTGSTGAATAAPAAPAATVATAATAASAASTSDRVEPPPEADSQKSPPAYETSTEPSHRSTGEQSGSNQFPPQFGGLLPSREDPTSPPKASASPVKDASAPSKNVFDEFDEFDDLAEAKEADKSGNDLDFGFGRQSIEEFNPAFDSPAASMSNTAVSFHTPGASRTFAQPSSTNGFADFQPSLSTSSTFGSATANGSSIQQTPASAQHDWDAIFSGLDSSKTVDTSLSTAGDPWGAAAAASDGPAAANGGLAANKPIPGRAVTPGTEHDDPILKRLTNMGYPRADALSALEKYDYDINKAVDHLTGS